MSPGRLFNLRGRNGKRRQQARKQGSEKAQAGEAEGSCDGKFRRGETGLARRKERQISQEADEHGALARIRHNQVSLATRSTRGKARSVGGRADAAPARHRTTAGTGVGQSQIGPFPPAKAAAAFDANLNSLDLGALRVSRLNADTPHPTAFAKANAASGCRGLRCHTISPSIRRSDAFTDASRAPPIR